MKKRIIALVAILLLGASLCGCKQNIADAASLQTKSDLNGTIADLEEDVYNSFLKSGEYSIASVDAGLEMGYSHQKSQTGDQTTFADLVDKMSVDESGVPLETTVSYVIFESGNRKELAVKVNPVADELETEVFLFCYYGDILHLSNTYYESDEVSVNLFENGYLVGEKVSPERGIETFHNFVDPAGKIRGIYSSQEISGELIADATDAGTYRKVYRKKLPDMSMIIYHFDEDTYYSYSIETDELSEKDQRFIIKTSTLGFPWLTEDELDSIKKDCLKELKLSETFFDVEKIVWHDLSELSDK